MDKILVDKKALQAVISAFNGQPHEIRELIALRGSKEPGRMSISDLTGEVNPIDQLEKDLLAKQQINLDASHEEIMQEVLALRKDNFELTLADRQRIVLLTKNAPPAWSGTEVKTEFTEGQLVHADPELKANLRKFSWVKDWPVQISLNGHTDVVKNVIISHLQRIVFAVQKNDLEILVASLEKVRDEYRRRDPDGSWERIVQGVDLLLRDQRIVGAALMFPGWETEVTGASVYLANGNIDFVINVHWYINQHHMVPKSESGQVVPVLQHNVSDVYAQIKDDKTYEYYHVHDDNVGNVEVYESFNIAMTHLPLQEAGDKIIESYRKLHVIWPKG